MEMRKCDKGHYYDASVHSSCPYCGGGRDTEKTMAMGMGVPPAQANSPSNPGGGFGGVHSSGGSGVEKTVAMGMSSPAGGGGGFSSGGSGVEKTVAMGMSSPAGGSGGRGGVEPTMPLGAPVPVSPAPVSVASEGKTIAMVNTEYGVDPVVGWLVRLNGKERGMDYRIHSENNFIGRSEKMDICIKGDETISRDKHAILTYDSLEKLFYFSAAEGRSVVRVNGKANLQTVELKPYDKLTIGKTDLLFVPLCGDRFEWGSDEA